MLMNLRGGERTGRRARIAATILALVVLGMLAGCGGDGGDESAAPGGPAALSRTLAYVVTDCREDAGGPVGRQALRIQQQERPPVTAAEVPTLQPVGPSGICQAFGSSRLGPFFVAAGVFQRLAVSPDGSGVVFELTDDFSVHPLSPLPADQRGIFSVRADGSGLRRLGPASREATFRFFSGPDDTVGILVFPGFSFSPDGRMIAFTDMGPGPAGEAVVQIATLALATGGYTQVTRLPAAPPFDVPGPATCCPRFLDDDTLTFLTVADADGSNAAHNIIVVSVRTDGSGLTVAPVPIVIPGSQIVPIFSITGTRRSTALFLLPGTPVNSVGGADTIQEIFLAEGNNLLQLTSFRRVDTGDPLLSADRERVFFTASADPFGANSAENCQIFSIDVTGGDLRQVTDFREGAQSVRGCLFGSPPGCAVAFVGQDPETQTLVIDSSCDPFGTNANGSQLFALRPDGTGLRQLTDMRGLVSEADGAVTVQLPGPFAYSTLAW